MSRQATIDRQAALDMMRAGDRDSTIAARFGTSRQAVNLLRASFLREGKIDANDVKQEQASTQGLSAGQGLSAATETQQRAITDEPSPQPQPIQSAVPPSFDQITDWLVQLIRQAADVRRLRADNAALRVANDTLTAQVARLLEELRQSTEALSRATAKSREFEDAMTRLNTPGYPLAQIPSPHPETQPQLSMDR
jgi:hypothetical protein